jgi:hypothetical protein
MNKWEKLFEEFLDCVDFTLMKHTDGWGVHDRQGANLGDIEGDRFINASDIIERMDVYITDYFFNDLEEELEAYNVDLEGREVPWSSYDWLNLKGDREFYNKNKKYFDEHSWEFDVLDMITNHEDEINLENVHYNTVCC